MRNIIQVYISKDNDYYVAEGVDLPFVTQAKTLDELKKNIQEAIELQLEGQNLADFDLAPNPSFLMNVEVPIQIHA